MPSLYVRKFKPLAVAGQVSLCRFFHGEAQSDQHLFVMPSLYVRKFKPLAVAGQVSLCRFFHGEAHISVIYIQSYLSRVAIKSGFGVSDQVRHKPGYTVPKMARGLKFRI